MLVIINAKIISGNETWEQGYIRLNKNKIHEVGSMSEFLPSDDKLLDVKGSLVTPGMIDIHIHGGYDVDTMDASAEGLRQLSHSMLAEGVTSFFATTITQSPDAISESLRVARDVIDSNETTLIGIHLEGPFVNVDNAGAQPAKYIIDPNADQFRTWQEDAGGHIKLVTYAPERPGARKLETAMAETGAIGSTGHTNATYAENKEAGVKHGTHLYNQMRGVHHREPGTVGYCLLERDVMVEIIPDGIHSLPKMVDFAYRLKGAGGLVVITDAMRAKGLPDGRYELGGQPVIVADGAARLDAGNLAGSVLTMDEAFRNIIAFTGCTIQEAVKMTSQNQAIEFGLKSKGTIAPGFDADLVIWDEEFTVTRTIHQGRTVFKKEEQE